MIKANSKILVLLIGIFFIPLSLAGCGRNETPSRETRIFEIKNTEEVFGKPDEAEVTVRKHYLILNPPQDLTQLKELVERYCKDHPIEREVPAVEGKNRAFQIYFYRESDDLPRDWQPDEGYLDTDRLEHHRNDLIASIAWSDADPRKEYDNYDKSKDGKVLKRMRFIEDQLVD